VDKEMREAFTAGAREAGKDPDAMPILAESFVFVGERSAAEKAAELWRFLPKAWEKYVDIPDPREILRQAEADVKIDEVLDNWIVSPEPQDHADAIQQLLDNGVTHVFVHTAQADQQAAIDFYGREVLPRLRRS